jgi:hypothetical protein
LALLGYKSNISKITVESGLRGRGVWVRTGKQDLSGKLHLLVQWKGAFLHIFTMGLPRTSLKREMEEIIAFLRFLRGFFKKLCFS